MSSTEDLLVLFDVGHEQRKKIKNTLPSLQTLWQNNHMFMTRLPFMPSFFFIFFGQLSTKTPKKRKAELEPAIATQPEQLKRHNFSSSLHEHLLSFYWKMKNRKKKKKKKRKKDNNRNVHWTNGIKLKNELSEWYKTGKRKKKKKPVYVSTWKQWKWKQIHNTPVVMCHKQGTAAEFRKNKKIWQINEDEGGAEANRLRRQTSDQMVLGSNPAVAAALSPWTRLFTPIVPRRSLHISFY